MENEKTLHLTHLAVKVIGVLAAMETDIVELFQRTILAPGCTSADAVPGSVDSAL